MQRPCQSPSAESYGCSGRRESACRSATSTPVDRSSVNLLKLDLRIFRRVRFALLPTGLHHNERCETRTRAYYLAGASANYGSSSACLRNVWLSFPTCIETI